MGPRLKTTVAIACLCAIPATPALAGSGGNAFVGGLLGGAIGGVIGNVISQPAAPRQREVVYERPIYRDRSVYTNRSSYTPPRPAVHDMSRGDLANLQVMLNRYGAMHGFSAGTPDGIYGPSTRQAIYAFQSVRGLPVTGIPSYPLLSQAQQAVAELDGVPVENVRGPAPPPPAPMIDPIRAETQRIEVNVNAGVAPVAAQGSAAPAAVSLPASAPDAPLPPSAGGLDVAGVTLGAPRDATRAALQSFAPGIQVQDQVEPTRAGKTYVARISAALASGGNRSDRVDVWYGPDPTADAADFVVRKITFGTDAGVDMASMEQGLTSKYGPAQITMNPGEGRKTLAWVLDGAGKPLQGDAVLTCVQNVGDGLLTQPGEAARSICGPTLVAEIGGTADAVTALTLRGRDFPAYFAQRDRLRAAPGKPSATAKAEMLPVKF